MFLLWCRFYCAVYRNLRAPLLWPTSCAPATRWVSAILVVAVVVVYVLLFSPFLTISRSVQHFTVLVYYFASLAITCVTDLTTTHYIHIIDPRGWLLRIRLGHWACADLRPRRGALHSGPLHRRVHPHCREYDPARRGEADLLRQRGQPPHLGPLHAGGGQWLQAEEAQALHCSLCGFNGGGCAPYADVWRYLYVPCRCCEGEWEDWVCMYVSLCMCEREAS